ncbi:11000_t:CDS:1 [Diversispora eburnea]|uniref:11000_t:CDS:1 n=2 Tax=Diversisporales TaxID=214509 RepID=A0A9N8W4D9_9GLOM|nr:11000_t:CDS:1 [Diversispora eburnea]CAG8558619.1 21673_t:CDS:1 [Dentiscutata erythropus]
MPITTKGLSLAARKNIRDELTNKIPQLVKTLNSVTGSDYEFTVDLSTLYDDEVKASPDNKDWINNNLGSFTFQYFDSLVGYIKNYTINDDLVCTNFIKLTDKKEIQLLHDEEMEEGYNKVEVVDGIIFIKIKPSCFGTNISGVGYNLIDVLKSKDEVLPVKAKKNIRDEWELKLPNLKKILKQAVGENYEFVVNFEELYTEVISAPENESNIDWYTGRLGEIVYGYFDSLINYIKNYTQKDDLVRSEFLITTSTRKFNFVIDDEIEEYNVTEVKDGTLFIKVKRTTLGTNSSSIGYNLIDVIKVPESTLPLKTKKDIRDEWETKIPALKKKLKAATGENYEFEIDFEDIFMLAIKANEDQAQWYKDRLGSMTYQYFDSLVGYIERYTKKDDLVRQEFIELTHAKTLCLITDDEIDEYNQIEINNGKLYIKVPPKYLGTNASPGYDLVDKLHAPNSVLPLRTKVNIRDGWDTKIPALKKKLKEATGEDIEFVVDFDNIYETAKKNSDDDGKWVSGRLGETTFDYYNSLIGYIVKLTKDDDLVREGFIEAVETKNIYLIFDEEITDYNDIEVKDGGLYIRIGLKYFGTNTGGCGYNLINVL